MNPSSGDRIKPLRRRGAALLGGAVAIFVGVLYFGTLAPTVLPYGDPAYRVNLASAVYGVAAVLVVYLAGLRLGGHVVAAAAGALAFGLSGTFWSQSVIAEVYTFEALLVALVILFLFLWRDRRDSRYLLLSAF